MKQWFRRGAIVAASAAAAAVVATPAMQAQEAAPIQPGVSIQSEGG